MTPLTLTPAETREAMTGKVTLARAVELRHLDRPQAHWVGLADFWKLRSEINPGMFEFNDHLDECRLRATSPHGKLGDEFWVREIFHSKETLSQSIPYRGGRVFYKATETHPELYRWYSPARMPQWASRLTLRNTGTAVKLIEGKWMFYTTMEGVGE